MRDLNISYTTWKNITNSNNYTSYFSDGGVFFQIFSGTSDYAYISTIYTSDIDDFNTNYPNAIEVDSYDDAIALIIGTYKPKNINTIGARGTGGWSPDPSANYLFPYTDETPGLTQDGQGSLITRGQILTDEGSFREDFSGTSLEKNLTGTLTFDNTSTTVTGTGTSFTSELTFESFIKLTSDSYDSFTKILRVLSDTELELVETYKGTSDTGASQQTKWIKVVDTGTSISVTDSKVSLVSGTTEDSSVYIQREGDYLPTVCSFRVSTSQRISNQDIFLGMFDSPIAPEKQVSVLLSGTNNTQLKFITSNSSEDVQETVVTLTTGELTSDLLLFQIESGFDIATLSVEDTIVATHRYHLPGPYDALDVFFGITNTGTPSSSTTLSVDTCFFSNQDQIQVASSFMGDSLPVKIREDIHYISGKLQTSNTNADQIVISYTVPTGKSFYIAGYSIDTNTSISADPFKIGRNSMDTEPPAPGIVDSNIFRQFRLERAETKSEDFSACPRKIGHDGDIIKMTVTPTGSSSTFWRGTIDFILR